MPRVTLLLPALVGLLTASLPVAAQDPGQPVHFQIRYQLAEELRFDVPLPDSPGHWLRAARFVGVVDGAPPLAGAHAVEMGLHDVFPGREGNGTPIYHVLTLADGSQLTLRGDRRLVQFSTDDGQPVNVYSGTWQVLGATGSLAGMQGGGIIRVRPVSPREIVQEFEGIIVR